MSDGAREVEKAAQKISELELLADALASALSATGDPMFYRVNPAAIRAANAILASCGYQLVEVES